MKTYMTPEEHARLHRRRARQTLGLLIAVLALVLVIGCAVGGTAAWLATKSDSIVSTFTYGDINIALTETEPEKKPAKIIPGVDIEKALKVTVKANSED